MRRPPTPSSNTEPLLFDLPLDHPAREDENELQLERQPDRAPRPARQATARPPRRPGSAGLLPGLPGTPGTQGSRGITEIGGLDAEEPLVPQARQARPDDGRAAADPAARAKAAALAQTVATPASRANPATATIGDLAEVEEELPVAIARRLAAGAADLLVHVAVAALALAGCRYLGVFPEVRDWPAGGIFLLSFSFLYTVVPLAFWGNTLGMTWAGLTSQSSDGEPLSFDQTARRWLGMLLTLAVAGLPMLLAMGGRSLADRLSGSRTLLADS